MNSDTAEGVLADVETWRPRYWMGVVLSAGIAAVNFYAGYAGGEQVFFVIGASFLVGVGLFFTRLWHPVLYLLGVLHIGALGVLWLLSGLPELRLGIVIGVMSLALVVVALSLFFEETDLVA